MLELGLRLPADTQDRMREHAQHGATLLDVAIEDTERVWGWQDSSLSLPVLGTSGAQLWMKVRSRPVMDVIPKQWAGVAAAERIMSDSNLAVLRPVLVDQETWTGGGWAYQAELTSRLPVRAFSPSRVAPEWMADLPVAWWTNLRAALDGIQELASAELTAIAWQESAARSVGVVDPASWVPSHGDVCAANLGAADSDRPVLFDWDYLGLGPRYIDAAGLFLSSLDTPDVAARVRAHFGDQLDSPAGLYAQSVIAAHWTKRFKSGEHVDLGLTLRTYMRTIEEQAPLTADVGTTQRAT
ncbi:phosphotransferase family protein [Streptomyces sp. NPDC058861]|uniref:phosphotransferase family protein n=1 Tax=Streptomyces sp. NPDC058861 TaxID=3346653 RepID=UPI00368EAA8B